MPVGRVELAEREFSVDLQNELLAYPGKWAVIYRGRLVFVADDPATAHAKAAEEVGSDEGLLLHHIPGTGISPISSKT